MKELLVDEQSPIPKERFLILPLDITTPHELPFPVYTERVDTTFPGTTTTGNTSESVAATHLRSNPIAHFTSAFLRRTRTVMREFGKDAMELVITLIFKSLPFLYFAVTHYVVLKIT